MNVFLQALNEHFGQQRTGADSEKSTATRKFNISRRKHIDRVFRSTRLSPTDKLVAYAVWARVNRQTGYTFAHPSTLARDIGVKHLVAYKSLERLIEAGHLGAKQQGDLVYLFPVPIKDALSPVMPAATKKFQQWIQRWLHAVLRDKDLSAGCRVTAYAVAAFTDPATGTCEAGYQALGELVDLSKKTVQRSIESLTRSKYISVQRAAAGVWTISIVSQERARQEARQRVGQSGGHSSGHTQRLGPETTMGYDINPEDPDDSSNPNNRSTPTGLNIDCDAIDVAHSSDQFEVICLLMGVYGTVRGGQPTMTIGGILKCAYLQAKLCSNQFEDNTVRVLKPRHLCGATATGSDG